MFVAGINREERVAAAPWQGWVPALILCLAGLTALRLVALVAAKTDLFFDEAQYWTWAQTPAFGYFSKPPLIAWAIDATTALCGDGEACIRLSSPLFHAGTAVVLFLAAQALYGSRIGFWSALMYATLPGVSFSANIISTDVPLLFFWAAALYFSIRLLQDRTWRWAIGAGVAIGLGLLSKYAMAYFYLCAAIWFIAEPSGRWLLRDRRGAALLVIPFLMLVPNLMWNVNHGLVTFAHTAANANLGGLPIHPLNMLEFFGAQFGVFGPILFGALLWIAYRCIRQPATPQERLLLSFSLPILAVVTVLAFLSRAHANWAATAFPAATILVTAVLLTSNWTRLLAASLVLQLAIFAAVAIGPAFADRKLLPGRADPFARMLGWRDTADAVHDVLAKGQYGTLLTDDRALTAELLYYLRDPGVPLTTWKAPGPPHDHYELTRPFRAGAAEPVLFVSLKKNPAVEITGSFSSATPVAVATVPTGPKSERTLTFTSLEGFRGTGDAPR